MCSVQAYNGYLIDGLSQIKTEPMCLIAICRNVSAHGAQCITFSGKAPLAGGHFLLSPLDVGEMWFGCLAALATLTLCLLARL